MNYHIVYVGYPLPPKGDILKLGREIRAYVDEETCGSGAGFGFRDLEFGPYPTKKEAEKTRAKVAEFFAKRKVPFEDLTENNLVNKGNIAYVYRERYSSD